MSTGDTASPAGNEQIKVSPPEAGSNILTAPPGERIELPPMSLSTPIERIDPRRGLFLDGILCLLLLLLAFLCASFKARNSDVFLSLATGRLIAEGKYTFGADPYSFASKGTWVNQSWLYDLGTYFLYGLAPDGIALVVFKALLVVVLAWLMLRAGTVSGEKLWVPILCTTVGVLALSPRLFLQSGVVSMLLLGVTIYLLVRSSDEPRRLWLLPPLFLLWVNLDAWFLLGPITVACFLAGNLIAAKLGKDQAPSPGGDPKTLGLVLVGCLIACLCNPHHVHAFTSLPVGIVQWGGQEVFKSNSYFKGFFLSPWLDMELYFRETIGLSVAGLSYFALLAFSLASFVCLGLRRPEALRPSRLIVWLFFVVLSGLQIRAIPFFAIVAAPLAALNFLDLVRLPDGSTSSRRNVWDAWAIPGRVFTFLGMVGLCVASITGAIQAQPHYRRAVGWGIETDAGLAGATKQIAAWKAAGVVRPGQNWMTLSPDTPSYLAWFAPEEKGFVDTRLSLFGDAAPEFETLRGSLEGVDRQDPDKPFVPGWRKLFRDREAKFFLFHNINPTRPSPMLSRLYSIPKEFVPVFVEGGTALFAWRDPENLEATPLDPRLVLDFEKRAFGKDAERAPERVSPADPWQWWHPLLRAGKGSSPEVALSLQYSTRFDALRHQYQADQDRTWLAMSAASLFGDSLSPNGPLAGGIYFSLRFVPAHDNMINRSRPLEPLDRMFAARFQSFFQAQDRGPSDSLYLAIRACRRALARNPEDAMTHLALAEAYSRVEQSTRERARTTSQSVGRPPQPFFLHSGVIRQTQIAAALQNVLKSDPSREQAQFAHLLLAQALRDPQYLESSVSHIRKYLEISRELKVLPGTSRENFAEEFKALEAGVKDAERKLKSQKDQYEVSAASKRGENAAEEKARIALANGLCETALKLLIDSKSGASLVAYILIGLGRIDEVDQLLTPQPDQAKTFDPRSYGMHPLGLPAYEWYQVQKSAAIGDYAAADRYLEDCMKLIRRERDTIEALDQLGIVPKGTFGDDIDQGTFAAALVGDLLLREGQRAAGLPWQWGQIVSASVAQRGLQFKLSTRNTIGFARTVMFPAVVQEANLWTIRAWLALEAGSIETARAHARQAISYCNLAGADPRVYLLFVSRPLTDLVLELIDDKSP